MEHESPIMKAWREFGLADPDNCDREWEAYLALVNKTTTSSVSPPTNTTPPLHNRVLGPAVVSSSSTTCSTASLHAPSSAMSSTAVSEESTSRWDRDDVYPPLAELRRALMIDAEWAAMSEWEKDLWEMKHLPEKERMNSIEGIVMWLPAVQQDQRRKELLEEILRFAEPSPTPDSSTTPASTTNSSIVISVTAELDVVPLAAHKDTTDLPAPTPTTRSTNCLNRVVPESALISSAIQISVTTTQGAMPEHCCINLEPAGDASMDVAASTTSSMTTTNVSERCCFNPEPAPTSSLDLLEEGAYTSSLTPTTYLLDDVNISKSRENMFPPWPPPWFVSFQDIIRCKDMVQVLLSDDLVLETQLMLHAAKNLCPAPVPSMCTGIQNIFMLDCQDIPFMSRKTLLLLHTESVELIRSRIGMWLCCFSSQSAELLAFCLAACRILNLHSTLDKNMQLSRDCQVLKIRKLKCSAVPIVITFVPGYQKAQLKPTLSKWSIPSCLDTQFLGASTLDFLLTRRAAHIVCTWCCLDYLHCYLGSTNWALQEEHRQVLLEIPWRSVGYHWEAVYPMKPCSAIHKLFIIRHWLIPWEPEDSSPGRNLSEKLTSLVTTCELIYSISLDYKLLADCYLLWCIKREDLTRVWLEAHFSLPSVNQGKLKCYSIFYASNSCWNGWHSLSLLIHWLHMPCLQLFWGLLCAVQGHVCSSTNVFLVNGESEVENPYTCTRVLTIGECKGCIYDHIQQVQWECPLTINLVPLKFWFQCCCAGHESLYNGENHQWTIAWYPGKDSLSHNLMVQNITISYEWKLQVVAAWCMFCPRFRPPETSFLVDLQHNNNKDMSPRNYLLPCVDHIQGALLGGYIMVGCLRSARKDELTQGHAADGVAAPFAVNETLLLPWDLGDYSSSAWRQAILGEWTMLVIAMVLIHLKYHGILVILHEFGLGQAEF